MKVARTQLNSGFNYHIESDLNSTKLWGEECQSFVRLQLGDPNAQ